MNGKPGFFSKLLGRDGAPIRKGDVPGVLIAVIGTDMVSVDFAVSLATMTANPGARIAIQSRIADLNFPVTTLRNNIVEEARAVGMFDRILFLNSDMAIPPDTLSHMLEWGDRDVVGAVYRNKLPPFNVICHTIDGEKKEINSGIHEVGVVPLGCCLIKMSTFDRLKRPYFREPFAEDQADASGGVVPDFVDFSNRVREAGMTVWADIDLSAVVGHVGKNLFMMKENYGEPRAAGTAVAANS